MIVMEDINMFISVIILMIIMIMTAKYLYCEKCFKSKRGWIIFGSIYLIAQIVSLFIKGEAGEVSMLLIFLLSFSGMIAITRTKKRIRGMFLILPVMGIIMSIDMIPAMIFNIVSGKSIDTLSNNMLLLESVYDVLIYTGIFILFKKKFKLSRTEIGIWERRILNGNGVLLLVIYCISLSIPNNLSQYEQYLLSGGVIIAIMIIGTSIIMTIESTNANNYRLQSEINEYYLQAQLEHFKEYQRTQTETRRVRHDMKNHMIGMIDLYERNEYEKLGEYLKDLSQLTQNIDKEFHIGNDMADAILNEKFSHKKQEKIELVIDGNIAGVPLAPIDICTIFANALDNAIEAINKLTLEKVTIEISVKRSNRILLITFTNPCGENCNVEHKKLNTSKKDYINHGFGIENIGLAADKYNGSVEYTIIEDERGQKLFSLEVMVMI